MFLFPLLMVEKKRQTMLSEIRKELEMNQKITTVNNLSYFIKEELKYYEYITHIIIDLEFIEEKGDEFLTSLKALVMATDVPIIIYAEGVYPGDMLLSEIARQGLANIIGETPKTFKQISRNKMQKDLREALIKSTADRRIGLREERQRRFDVTDIPVQKGNNNAIPNYNNCDLHLSIGLFGAMRRVGTTTYAIQLAEYFTARGAKVAFFSKNELTDGDLNILQETYKEETVSKGTYFTYRNIDFYFFGRVPENWGIYNVVINDYGTDTEQIDNWLSCHYRYIVSGFNETDIIQLMSLLETDKNDTKRLIGRDYRIAFNFGEPSMCGEQYRYLCSELAPTARITMNGFLPYKFNLPQWFLQTCDTEFENYRMYISNIKR